MKALFISTVSAVFAAVNVFAVPGKPYTHLNYLDDLEEFSFAIIPDRHGADRDGT